MAIASISHLPAREASGFFEIECASIAPSQVYHDAGPINKFYEPEGSPP
jgi:hypothetical protein